MSNDRYGTPTNAPVIAIPYYCMRRPEVAQRPGLLEDRRALEQNIHTLPTKYVLHDFGYQKLGDRQMLVRNQPFGTKKTGHYPFQTPSLVCVQESMTWINACAIKPLRLVCAWAYAAL